MADITSPQIISFDNTRVRVLADQMTALYAKLVAFQNDYAAFGMAALIAAAGAANNVGDGYAVDGRIPVTGTQILNFKAAIDQLVTSYGTNVAGVGAPITTIQNAIQVNGSVR